MFPAASLFGFAVENRPGNLAILHKLLDLLGVGVEADTDHVEAAALKWKEMTSAYTSRCVQTTLVAIFKQAQRGSKAPLKNKPNAAQLAERVKMSNEEAKGEVVTEAMAEVLLLQGKRDKALAVYDKLSLLNPDKRAYFAARIKELNAH